MAYQALSHCLQSSFRSVSDVSYNLEFHIEPLQHLFQSRPFRSIIFILPILANRFDRTFDSVLNDINWSESFRIEVDTFDTLMTTSAKQFAIDVTKSDQRDLDLLCPADFKYPSEHLKYLAQKSNNITMEISEICQAHPSLMQYFGDVAKVRKYYFNLPLLS